MAAAWMRGRSGAYSPASGETARSVGDCYAAIRNSVSYIEIDLSKDEAVEQRSS